MVCPTSNECRTVAGTCAPATGCPVPVAINEGGVCNDSNPNSSVDLCQGGTCTGSNPVYAGSAQYAAFADLGRIDGSRSSTANKINNGGEIAGREDGPTRSVVWRKTGASFQTPIGLAPEDADRTGWEVLGMNESGVIVGSTGFHGEGFMAAPGQNAQIVTDLRGYGSANAINNAGQIAGSEPAYVGNAYQGYVTGFRRDVDGTKHNVGQMVGTTLGGGTLVGWSAVSDIAPGGTDLVGTAYMAEASRTFDGMFEFAPPWGMREAYRFADPYSHPSDRKNMNDYAAASGWDLLYEATATNGSYITGWGVKDGRCRAFRFTVATNQIVDLGSLDETHPEADGCYTPNRSHFRYYYPTDINEFGEIVGSISYGGAFYYSDATGMIDLQDFVDPILDVTLGGAHGINSNHEIVGGMGLTGDSKGRAFKMKLPSAVGNPNPQEHVALRIDGIIDTGTGNGPFIAVMGYNNISPVRIDVPLGASHTVTVNDGPPLADPQPRPPTVFLPQRPQQYPGTFLPRFKTGETIKWTVAGQTVSASSATIRLTKVPIGTGGYGVQIGDEVVTIQPDLSAYTNEPALQGPDPVPGGVFKETLAGTLEVSPTGAATYTVPIAIPPGIAGMAPSLNLIYNSQGADGIAGQGWELSGMSMIHRCARTKVQDGYADQVDMTAAFDVDVTGANVGSDAICLDGKRLFARSTDTLRTFYETEQKDFTQIAYEWTTSGGATSPNTFKVVTKSGEMRLYGRRADSVITAPGSTTTAIWALDRVQDIWGNYYDIYYYPDAATNGLRISEIKYTGHLVSHRSDSQANEAAIDTFNTITFNYEPRADVRIVRMGTWTMKRTQRLTTITTPRGTYNLTYATPVGYLPSRLWKIDYCSATPSAGCLNALEFDWDFGNYGWESEPNYALPASIDAIGSDLLPGTQFVDLNGDGRVDFVSSKDGVPAGAWENNGGGWTPQPTWALPASLVNSAGTPSGVLLADVNGDGLPDVLKDKQSTANPTLQVWLNRTNTSGDPWPLNSQLSLNPGGLSLQFKQISRTATDTIADMNGDGRADIVHPYAASGSSAPDNLRVFFGSDNGWTPAPFGYSPPDHLDPTYALVRDINRDGLADRMSRIPISGTHRYPVAINTGDVTRGSQGTVWKLGQFDIDLGSTDAGSWKSADVDGDGLLDSVTFHPSLVIHQNEPPGCGFTKLPGQGQLPPRCNVTYNGASGKVLLSTGRSYEDAAAYSAAMTVPASNPNYVSAFADLNADGLADMVRGGFLYVNTGTTWQVVPGAQAIPVVPDESLTEHNGAAFIDLNGDGVVDLVQSTDDVDAQGNRFTQAWINKFRPPVITRFPDGGARKSEVVYEAITTKAADDRDIYSDSKTLDAGLRFSRSPVRVVSSVSKDNGLGALLSETTYGYVNIRASTDGRGSQGFRQIVVTDPSGTSANPSLTLTTYSQSYPYSGMPVAVARFNQGFVSTTSSTYCDKFLVSTGDVCTPPTGAAVPFPPRTSLFVYPSTVVNTSYLRTETFPEAFAAETMVTTTDTRFDVRGNLKRTTVTTEAKTGATTTEKFLREITNTYENFGDPNYPVYEQQKVTRVDSYSQRLFPQGTGLNGKIFHATEFEYGDHTVVDSWTAAYHGHYPMVLKRKKIEPRSPASQAMELHVAYEYDRFGNIVIQTSCDNDFDNCRPGNPGPTARPFRTARTSYDPAEFAVSGGPGVLTSVPYGPGRFPVKMTNAVGHKEYDAFDPVTGLRVQHTDPNGTHTCFGYDAFGFQTEVTNQCGSTDPEEPPLKATMRRHNAMPSDPYRPNLAARIVVTDPQVGASTWAYEDLLGRPIATMTRALDGSLSRTETTFDRMGRVLTRTKPHKPGGAVYATTVEYDPLGRVKTETQELGVISGTTNTTTVVATRYRGRTVVVSQTVNGVLRERSETKNALGKTAVVVDGAEDDPERSSSGYFYDADGNVTDTTGGPVGSVSAGMHVDYDALGRRTDTYDPDAGHWHFTYNGFGDVVRQTDANDQVTLMTYDAIGRLIARSNETGGDDEAWEYDHAPGGGGFAPGAVGKVVAQKGAPDSHFAGNCTLPGYFEDASGTWAGRLVTYSPRGRLKNTIECIDGETFATDYTYDSAGRKEKVTYPTVAGSRLVVQYHYSELGFLHYVKNASDGGIYWVATAADSAGLVSGEYLGNGVEVVSDRNPSTGWLKSSIATAHVDGKVIQGWNFSFDERGNVLTRDRSGDLGLAESYERFGYDTHDWLTSSEVRVPAMQMYVHSEAYTYDAGGNITAKAGVPYTYGNCNAGPHAVCRIGTEVPFTYDLNGNLRTGSERSIGYNARNKVTSIDSRPAISRGNDTGIVGIMYGVDGNRAVQATADVEGHAIARTLYVGMNGTGKSAYERTTRGTTIEHTQFLYAGVVHGGNAFALRVVTEYSSTGLSQESTKYYHTDQIGSVTAITDELGRVTDVSGGPDAGVLGYDPWGARRAPDGRWAEPASFHQQDGRREFTGHEGVPLSGLVNMNGRIYDPKIGRFLSPDPIVQFAANLQSYNRYSYVLNNPLRYTDPTGYWLPTISDQTWGAIAVGLIGVGFCALGGPVACLAYSVAMIGINAAMMHDSGANGSQILQSIAIGVAASAAGGFFSGAFAGVQQGLIMTMVGGAVSAIVSTVMETAARHGDVSFSNLGKQLAMGAVFAGLGWAAAKVAAVSAKSSTDSGVQGGGDDLVPQSGRCNAECRMAVRKALGKDAPEGDRSATDLIRYTGRKGTGRHEGLPHAKFQQWVVDRLQPIFDEYEIPYDIGGTDIFVGTRNGRSNSPSLGVINLVTPGIGPGAFEFLAGSVVHELGHQAQMSAMTEGVMLNRWAKEYEEWGDRGCMTTPAPSSGGRIGFATAFFRYY